MSRNSCTKWVLVSWCIVTLSVPQAQTAEQIVKQELVRDVSLDDQGMLRGSVVSAEGKPQRDSEVVIRKGVEVIAVAKTKADGTFALPARPGVYEIASNKSSNLFRVWTSRTAPPAAKNNAMLVEQTDIVRGQESSPLRRAVILGGVIITSGVIGGVIGYNIKDDDSAS